MAILPGKKFKANPTATGHVPVYKANGMLAYLITLATLCVLFHTGRFVTPCWMSLALMHSGRIRIVLVKKQKDVRNLCPPKYISATSTSA